MKELLFQNGDKLPQIGLGTWLSKPNEVYDAVLEAIRMGYRHIDCAYIYGNEKEIGLALQDAMKEGLVKREDLFITSKLWNSDHAPGRVEMAISKSLTYLKLDYLDLYLIHWPVAFKAGREQAKDITDLVPLEVTSLTATWQAMEQVQIKGLTRHIGVSNFNIPKLELLKENAIIKPELNQVELHPFFQQNDLLTYCKSQEILVTAFSPLGSRHTIQAEDGLIQNKTINSIATKHSCTPAQVALAWGMNRGTAVIPKSVHAERILENFESIQVHLDEIDINAIATLERNLRLAKGSFCVFPGGPYTLKSIWEE